MAGIQSDRIGTTQPLSGQYSFADSDFWVPQIQQIQDAPNNNTGSVIFTSGALFVASGSGKWHKFNLSVPVAALEPDDPAISGKLVSWVGGSTPNMQISGVSGVQFWNDDSPVESGDWKDVAGGASMPSVASGVKNGREAVYFAGAQELTGIWANQFEGSDTPCTMIAVIRNDVINEAAWQSIVSWSRSTTDTPYQIMGIDDTPASYPEYRFERGHDAGGSIYCAPSGHSTGDWQVIAYQFPGTQVQVYKNRQEATIFASGMDLGVCTFDRATMGAMVRSWTGYYFNGMIGEVAIYASGMTTAHLQAVSKSMMSRWDI